MGGTRGGRPPGRVPYGYTRRYQVVGGKAKLVAQEPHPDEAPVVAEIITSVAQGVPPSAIATSLNARGIPGPHARPWRCTRIRDYVSPIYIGKRTHRGRVYDTGWWPAIVDEDAYYTARRVLYGRHRADAHGRRLKLWLSAILVGVSSGRRRYQRSAGHRAVVADNPDTLMLALHPGPAGPPRRIPALTAGR